MKTESHTKDRLERLRLIRLGNRQVKRLFFSDFKNKEFMEWNICEAGGDAQAEAMIKSRIPTHVIDWCNDNCSEYFVAYRGKFYFEAPEDAAFFTMVWG